MPKSNRVVFTGRVAFDVWATAYRNGLRSNPRIAYTFRPVYNLAPKPRDVHITLAQLEYRIGKDRARAARDCVYAAIIPTA